MIAIGYLVFFLLGGLLIIRFLLPSKNPLTRIWLGVSLGMLLLMQFPALFARLFRFSLEAHIASAVALVVLVTLCFFLRDRRHALCQMREEDWRMLAAIVIVCLPLTVLSAYLQHTHMIMEKADGSLWCGQSTYGDLCMHLSFITSMRDMQFPPSYTLLINTPMAYPYLVDSLSTSMMLLGMSLHWAVVVPGTLLMALTYVGYMMLSRAFLGKRNKAIVVCALLFFFNGGLGFLYDFDMVGKDNFARVMEIFSGYYKTPANQPSLNLRFSNVIVDLMIPQRALLGGWAMALPAMYLLVSSCRAQSMRQTVILALWAGSLPLVHTHTFLALGLFSGGYLIGRMITHKEERLSLFARSVVYLFIVLIMALRPVMDNAVRQTVEGGSLRFQFNWVNNSGNAGLIDGYFWFWVKNAGLPFILMLCACLDVRRRGRLDILLGMAAVFIVAELVIFQPNEYDNNKLFYIWYMFAIIFAVDYGSVIMQRLAGLRGRVLLCAVFLWASMFSGALSIAREVVSGYELFSPEAVEAGEWIDENTSRDAVFLTGQHHLNPVCTLAGRQIICGSDLYVFFHGLNYFGKSYECQKFYENPEKNLSMLKRYGVDYIYVSYYEIKEFDVDLNALNELFEIVYENPEARIYAVGEQT